MPKYPDINVKMVGEDGNAFAILGRVAEALKKGGVSQEERSKFRDDATSGDYNQLLRTVMKWVVVDQDEEMSCPNCGEDVTMCDGDCVTLDEDDEYCDECGNYVDECDCCIYCGKDCDGSCGEDEND